MRMVSTTSDRSGDDRRRERGQVAVIFGGAMVLFLLLAACVIDLSWYWTSNLRMQRAADAAALAGVVFLPGDVPGAFSAAYAEATKNGYTSGVNGMTVTPSYDPGDPRRLKVSISGRINSYFARVAGINSFPARRDAKADYVLPVPMGSPQNYYGVGFYEGRVATTTNVPSNTAVDTGGYPWNATSLATSGGQWTNPDRAFSSNASYASESTSGERQVWQDFNLQGEIANNPTLVIDGLEVGLTNVSLTGSGTSTNCTLAVEVTWNGGSNWSTPITTTSLTTTVSDDRTVGSSSTTSFWGPHTWTRNDFSNSNFRVRLMWTDGTAACAATRNVQLDLLEVRVQFHTTTTTWTTQTLSVNDPVGGTPLASQGFWGAMFTSGGVRENGDRHGPSNLGAGAVDAPGPASPTYDANGYDYTLELPGGNGQVRLFDPMFCATGPNSTGGSFGAGDHWTGRQGGGQVVRPVAITYRLYNTNGTVANVTDDGPPVATLTYDPGAQTMADVSGAMGTPSPPDSGQPAHTDCSGNPAHNQWVLPAGMSSLGSGIYRLNVNTTLNGINANVGAENLFSIWVQSSGSARVFGSGRMAAYTNLSGGLQKFYFAEIGKEHAGKTMEIQLFDPGESSGNAFLRILSPDGNAYNYATFDWSSDDGRSGTNVSQIQTSTGTPLFNNKLVTIEVDLPANYGSAGLDPPGDVTTEQGWWQIEYNIAAANDTTTWSVSIRGNPVHLVLP
jgi:putative Flp pilus-assembly TadE/G-like protein